jgi:uncharacterized membrane protein YvbJ
MPNGQCPQCGTVAPPESNFCGNCGAPLAAAVQQASTPASLNADNQNVILKSIRTFESAVFLLGAIALAVVIGGVWLLLTGGNPTSLIPIATAAVAGLAGLLTQPAKQQ